MEKALIAVMNFLQLRTIEILVFKDYQCGWLARGGVSKEINNEGDVHSWFNEMHQKIAAKWSWGISFRYSNTVSVATLGIHSSIGHLGAHYPPFDAFLYIFMWIYLFWIEFSNLCSIKIMSIVFKTLSLENKIQFK